MREKKDGRGSAVIEGLRYAHTNLNPDIFIEMDADLFHNPKEILKMISLSKPKTVVIASRYMSGGKILNVQFRRRIASYLANLLIRLTLKNPIIDNTNGFRCYRKDAIGHLLKHRFISKGYILLSESATVLKKNGFKFVEFPSLFVNRKIGKSNATFSEFKNSLVSLLDIRKRYEC